MEQQTTAANPGEVAASQTPEGTQQTTAESGGQQTQQQDITQTQAFAHRLKEATTEAEKRARDAVIAEIYGESHGIRSYDEYQKALREQQQAQEAQAYGIDPRFYQKLSQSEQKVQTLEEKLNAIEREKVLLEQDRTLESDPTLGDLYKQFKSEVHDLAQKTNADYDIAFTLLLREKIPTLLSGMKTQSEQEAIKKLTQNAQTSTGPLGGGDVQHNKSISKMSKEEFKKLEEAVLRGEVKNL